MVFMWTSTASRVRLLVSPSPSSPPPPLPLSPPPLPPPSQPPPHTTVQYIKGTNAKIVPIHEPTNCSTIFQNKSISIHGSDWSCEFDESGSVISDKLLKPGEAYIVQSHEAFDITVEGTYEHNTATSNTTKASSEKHDCNSLFDATLLTEFSGGGRLTVQGLGWSCDYINSEHGFIPNYMITPGDYYIVINGINATEHISYSS